MDSFNEFHVITGILVFVMATLGLITNGGVIFYSRRTTVFNSCIGHLIRCEASGAFLFCLVFLFYIAPVLTFSLSWQSKSISARFGHIAIFSHDVCLFSHACISVNRFVASYFYSYYAKIFTNRATSVLAWTIPILAAVATVVHFFESCWLFFLFKKGFFVYDNTSCGQILSMMIQFPRNVALICICSAMDIASLAKLKILNRKNRSFTIADNEWKRRQRVEIALMSQVCCQALMYIIEFLTYFVFSAEFSNPYVVFLMTTFAWQAVHTMDGILVFLFNRDMKNALFKSWKASPSTLAVAPVSSGRLT